MRKQLNESDSDSLPYDHLNSKIQGIEKAVNFFYEKMKDNYDICMNEVGTLKDYIELKSEKKANSRMNSAYSNHASALKTPVQGNRLRNLNISSKNTPFVDGMVEIGQHTSNSKANDFRDALLYSHDATPEVKYDNEDYYNFKDASRNMESKNKNRQMLSRNNSGYGPNKIGLNRYNSAISQSTTSVNRQATKSFVLHL